MASDADRSIVAGATSVAAGTALLAVAGWWGGSSLVLPLAASLLAGVGMGLQSSSTALATMQLSPAAEIGRNTSALQVGETTGNALLTGAAGTIFAALAAVRRDGLEPGMIVEHRQRYVVTNQRYSDESLKHAGQLKLRPVGDVEQVAIAYADRMAYGRTAEEVE